LGILIYSLRADDVIQADVDANEIASDDADDVIQADVDANEIASDAADLALTTVLDSEVARAIAADNAFALEDIAIRNDYSLEDAAIRNEFALEDAAIRGEFAAADAALQNQIAANNGAISRNRSDIKENRKGIAMVAAMVHTTVLPGMNNALDVNVANFDGENGLAITYSRRVSDNVQLNIAGATTTDFDESVIRAGVGIQW
jgi:hypothetical protein